MDLSGIKKSPIKTTIAIPSSLFQTKKLVEDRATQAAETKGVVVAEKTEWTASDDQIMLTQQLMDRHIFSIQEEFRIADRKMELAILDKSIKVRDGGEVVLEVRGHMQEEIASKMKPDLVNFIRRFTGAERVVIILEVKEEVDNGKPKLYTNSDKLNFLREKHPALAEFQRKFGLDVDF